MHARATQPLQLSTMAADDEAAREEPPLGLTVAHLETLVRAGLFTDVVFYRSDFVVQTGLQRADGSAVPNLYDAIPINETTHAPRVSNTRGTAAFGHWDVPDNGNSDWFINLKANPHLDTAYGG